jgi:hypothetical protein
MVLPKEASVFSPKGRFVQNFVSLDTRIAGN